MKKKVVKTRDELIEDAVLSITEVPSTTRVKAWVFCLAGVYYQVICFYQHGSTINIYTSNKKGKRTSQEHIVSVRGSDPIPVVRKFAEDTLPTESISS